MRFKHLTLALSLCALVVNFQASDAQLRQDTFNIETGKKITATATCGYDLPEGEDDELFCKLSTVPGKYGINGLECDRCDRKLTSGKPQNVKDHRIEYAIDGSDKWWQSPPLSRGLQYNEINITIDLEQAFHVVYVVVKAANSPLPGTWILERSTDFGQTYQPWYYFAPSISDCIELFNTNPRVPLLNDDQVECTSQYSKIPPFENGEMFISLVNGRPSALRSEFSPKLQDWMKATNVRLRLLKAKTLLGEFLPLSKGDPTVTRRYFYSIKDITIGGLCICNGYADDCVYGPSEDRVLACQCQKNTCGPSCSECCPGYAQYKWKSGYDTGEGCEACNCFGHSSQCYYSELVEAANRSLNLAGEHRGGGVCVDCQDNTFGNNCELCKHKFYNPTGVPMTNRDACVPCNCNEQFSTGACFNGDGQCQCKENYAGKKCNKCSVGFYGFPDCKPCQCNAAGTRDGLCEANGDQCPCKDNFAGAKCDRCARGFYNFPRCDECKCDERGSYTDVCELGSGQCPCLPNFRGRTCDRCADGYYRYPNCRACSCDENGVTEEMCNKGSGACICKPGFNGTRCSECAIGYYGYPSCRACQCFGDGSVGPECDRSGRCSCKPQYAGFKCERCAAGYYDYPSCTACTCDREGSLSDYCNRESGQCRCKENFSGVFCNQCKPGFYGYPNCQECGCNPAGVKPVSGKPLGDCISSDTGEGQCHCKEYVYGPDCSECKPKKFNLTAGNPFGCQECRCNVAGVIGGIEVCDEATGRCLCKQRVTSKRCEICKDGFYALKGSNAFGCSGCNCDVGGSYSPICGKYSGQCECRPNVGGRACDRPLPKHYHADLFQLLSEIEDGRTPENTSVRFRYDEQEFPGFSWRGYGVFSYIQRSVIVRVNAKWPENYHMVFHYVLDDTEDATGEVVVRRAGGAKGVTQRSRVTFKPTVNGSHVSSQFVVVAENDTLTQFAMLDRQYDIQFTTDSKKLLLDYVSIVPVFYPGPRQTEDVPEKRNENVLEDIVTHACEVNGESELDDLCVQYSFVGVKKPGFVKIEAKEGYIYDRAARKEKPTQEFSDAKILKELDFSSLALLDRNQSRLNIRKKVPISGKYVVLAQYFTTRPNTQFLDLYVRSRETKQEFARFRLPSCKYTFGCRTVGLTVHGAVKTIDLKSDVSYLFTALTSSYGSIAVESFILIPYEKWVTDYIVPSKLCVTRMKVCTHTSYSMPGDAVMVEAGESGDAQNIKKPPNIFDSEALLVYLEGKDSFEKQASVPKTGDYAIVVHYYQPYDTTVESETSVSSVENRRGTTSFKYCPNTSGCRTVVKRVDGRDMFKLGNKVTVNFRLPQDNKLWIDYILFVPKESYSPVLSSGEPVDRTNDFVEHCSKNNLHVTKDDGKFCTQSVFSLATFYNNGSFPCECDTLGSRDESCDVFGGQCSCFENIIGRACTRCKTGYYGFPDCRKCECDYCDPDTGLCRCPPNTVGEECRCVKGTFGYDPVQGCLPCDCDSTGVTDAASCDTASGQCACLPSRAGRRCDQCKPGYYGYPNCRRCDCDADGITGCDAETGQCICKEYVAGSRCDLCKIGYFYLSRANPKGCLECWCSGQTNQCDAVISPVAPAGGISGNWKLQGDLSDVSYERQGTKVVATISDENVTFPLYWALELGDMTNAYGRVMRYVTSAGRTPDAPLALIDSNGERILYKETVSSLGGGRPEISLAMNDWTKSDGSALTRDEFMRALVQVDLLHVLASDGGGFEISFNDPVMLPFTTSQVEKCNCPANTTGLSCQDCNEGYFRSGELCIPCQCNGHSSRCNPKTGECYDCQHDTTGEKCDECIPGYYGDATSGEADACQRCPCPDSSKNYATSCFQDMYGRFNCSCQAGYTGQLCDECADGYFGDPLTVGCKPCECNGNIDLAATGNCDRRTGVCLRCVNNTAGERCEKCQAGYYGNGILGNCRRCECDTCGSASTICNDVTGECSCKPGVTGQRCTACKAGTWGFDSCNGCLACGCSGLSLHDDCNAGQCVCQVGVTGMKCDICDDGYFGYTEQGCQACSCPTGQVCDINNGRCCEADDPTCKHCPPYHIRTAAGCEYCGPCEERLFRRVDKLLGNYSRDGGDGVATDESKERLKKVEIDLKNLTDRVDKYNVSIRVLIDVVDGKDTGPSAQPDFGSGTAPTPTDKPDGISLEDDANKLIDESMNIVRKATDVNTRSDTIKKNSTKTKEDAYDIEERLRKLLRESQGCPPPRPLPSCPSQAEDQCADDSRCSTGQLCCQHAECRADVKICKRATIDPRRILNEVRRAASSTRDVLTDIHKILLIIRGRDYSQLRSLVEREYQLSLDALRDSMFYMNETATLHNKIVDYKPKFDNLEAVMRNQQKLAGKSFAVSANGKEFNEQASKYKPDAIIEDALKKKQDADVKLGEATDILQEAKDILNNIKFPNTTGNTSVLNKYLQKFDARIANLTKENALLRILVNNATEHANNLKNLSDFLQSLLRDPQKYAEKALKAVEAYDDVAKAIEEVFKIAREANRNSFVALDLSMGLGANAAESKNTSVGLENDANGQKNKIPVLRDWLERLESLIKEIRDNFEDAKRTLDEVTKPFPKFDNLTSTLGGRTKDVGDKARKSESDSRNSKATVDAIQVPSRKALEDGEEEALNLLDSIEQLVNENENTSLELSSTLETVKLNQSLTEELLRTEVVELIKRIRFNIERGRDKIRNFPSSAGEYNSTTSVELRIPETAYGPSMQTRVSFDVATDQDDALLMFLGNAEEYLAFQAKDGDLQLVFNNDGETTTLDTGLDIKKGDLDWKGVEFVKTGSIVEVIVTTNSDPPQLRAFSGTFNSSLFTLKPDDSYLFVGAPPEGFNIPSGLETMTLAGGLDHLFVDGRRVGLYDAKNYKGTVPPTQLKSKEQTEKKELQFYGSGYHVWKGYRLRTQRSLTVKTAAQDGVIVFATIHKQQPEKSYMMIEIINGTIGFRFKLAGSDLTARYTTKRYDDNKDHVVEFSVTNDGISLNVDGGDEIRATDRGFNRQFVGIAYVGGINRDTGYHKVITTPGFIGCMFSNFLSAWDEFGVKRGCDSTAVSTASFSGGNASLEIASPLRLSTDTQVGSLFKSSEDGLLMNFEGEDGEFLAIGMEDGELKIDGKLGDEIFGNLDPGRRRRRNAADKKLNDNKWHSYAVRIKNGVLQVLVDNVVVFEKKLSKASTGKAFKLSFGGVKNKEESDSALVRRSPSFQGEMRDPVLVDSGKANMIDFADAEEKTGVSLEERPVPYFEQPVGIIPAPEVPSTIPEIPTTTKTIITTTAATESTTDEASGSGSTTISSTTPDTTTPDTTTPDITRPQGSSTMTEPTETTTTTSETTPTPETTTTLQSTTTTERTTTTKATLKPTTTPITTPTTEPTTTPTTPTTPVTTTTLQPTPQTTTPLQPDTIPKPTPSTRKPTAATGEQCSSPRLEHSDSMAITGRGYAEYKITEKQFGLKGGVSFEFKTFASNGILFYSAQKKTQNDFITCYLEDGKVYFGFNTGSGSFYFTTDNIVNDGKWKKVAVYRHKVEANMTVDGVHASKVGKAGPSFINGISSLYFGGYHTTAVRIKNEMSRVSISACIRRIKWHSGTEFPQKPFKEQFVSRCFKAQQEKSVYFSGGGSYIAAEKVFKVGRKKVFSLEIKPRNLTGLLVAVVNSGDPVNGDYLVLELNQGSVLVRVQNGDGVIEVAWTPTAGQSLCDNRWHKISVSKVEQNVILKVDSNPSVKFQKGSKTLANTKHPLFIGGIPENVESAGLKVRSSFQGCIRDFKIKNFSVRDLTKPVMVSGDVSMYGCPRASNN